MVLLTKIETTFLPDNGAMMLPLWSNISTLGRIHHWPVQHATKRRTLDKELNPRTAADRIDQDN